MRTLADYDPDRVSRIARVPVDQLQRAARLYGGAERPAIVYGLGVTEHAHGTDGVRTLANLAILRGTVGTPRGCGIMPLRGQNNVQGASDMGALPDLLPGYQKVSDAAIRAPGRSCLGGRPPPAPPGLRIPEMFDAALDGRSEGAVRDRRGHRADRPGQRPRTGGPDACDFVVVQEIFPSRTAQLADVVLPAAAFLEKDGTFVNFDRRFQRVRPALAPPGEARTDFDIITRSPTRWAPTWAAPHLPPPWTSVPPWRPLFGGVSHDRLDRRAPLHWPCRSTRRPGRGDALSRRVRRRRTVEPALGRARTCHRASKPDAEYPFVLVTGRRLEHYNAGTMTRRTGNLALLPRERLDLHPDRRRPARHTRRQPRGGDAAGAAVIEIEPT